MRVSRFIAVRSLIVALIALVAAGSGRTVHADSLCDRVNDDNDVVRGIFALDAMSGSPLRGPMALRRIFPVPDHSESRPRQKWLLVIFDLGPTEKYYLENFLRSFEYDYNVEVEIFSFRYDNEFKIEFEIDDLRIYSSIIMLIRDNHEIFRDYTYVMKNLRDALDGKIIHRTIENFRIIGATVGLFYQSIYKFYCPYFMKSFDFRENGWKVRGRHANDNYFSGTILKDEQFQHSYFTAISRDEFGWEEYRYIFEAGLMSLDQQKIEALSSEQSRPRTPDSHGQ